ncbi:Histidine kinase 5-like protein 2 [Colletotrichum chlorophyti]|uniref:Histidine kinase 5-like protein 2 n=1 Tax=Colletotrichum chlorophyti TaxID=708187 RepID=A0A1Q8S273_9PEZI|nr:Histidine kinase 5-like protein 2 [Colletotrichum chlorophyti]
MNDCHPRPVQDAMRLSHPKLPILSSPRSGPGSMVYARRLQHAKKGLLLTSSHFTQPKLRRHSPVYAPAGGELDRSNSPSPRVTPAPPEGDALSDRQWRQVKCDYADWKQAALRVPCMCQMNKLLAQKSLAQGSTVHDTGGTLRDDVATGLDPIRHLGPLADPRDGFSGSAKPYRNGRRFGAVSEGRREQETFRLALLSISSQWSLLTGCCRYDPSLIAQAVHNDLNNLIPSAELRASPDPALTAFAELAVLRLKTSRALISLFDRNYQYIVAEATPSLPLTPYAESAGHEVGEHLVLCGTAIPRAAGICELALGNSRPPLAKASLGGADVPITIIPDLAADPRSSQRAFCHLAPENRFYIGVPLRTSKGIDIGVLCVFDTRPRGDLDDISIRFVRDLSQVVVDYLDFRRQRENHRRADRMVRGVGSFVEGKSTISEWKTANESPEILVDDLPQEGSIDKMPQHVELDLDLQAPDTPTSCSSPSGQLQIGSPHHQPASQERPLRRPGPTPISNPTSSDAPTKTGRSTSSFARTHPQEPRTRHIFSKATNVIREAIDVDFVLFLEASIRSFGGLAESTSYPAKSLEDSLSSSSSSDEMEYPQQCEIGNRSQGNGKPSCRVLGFSSPSVSSMDGDPPSQAFSSVSEGFLTKLLRRYPEGKIFNFDARGTFQSSDDSRDETISGLAAVELSEESTAAADQPHWADPSRKRSTERASPLNEAREITAIFPGARSVAIVPLWDTEKHRWYAGGFVCSTNPGRTFAVEHELSYLRAFGIVIMSEVDRLKAQLTERSKIDLLSSLSHDLRSPLHGIILGAELLSDTPLDAFQGEMLASIETCSRTLLDTMNHLLDLSKINNFIGPASRRRTTKDPTAPSGTRGFNDRGVGDRGEGLGIEAGMMSIASNFELDVLAEEVVESVCAGFSYQRQSIAHLVHEQSTERAEDPDMIRRLDSILAIEDVASTSRRRGDLLMLLGDFAVTLDISPAVSWTFHAQSGAIRRIIMNLLGNSLKFTSKGIVNVSVLQLLQDEGKPQNFTNVKIIVTDTGRGMSENYLCNHLFTSFCQEDSLSAGLGLGLSLVNQIVAKLGGSIQVASKLGQGTKVTVVLPLRGAAASSPTDNPTSAGLDEFNSLAGQLKGLRVRLLGLPTEHNVHGVGDPSWLKGTRSEGALLANFCAEWLRMHIVEPSVSGQLLADLIITTEISLEDLLAGQRHGGISTPVVVICRNALLARQLANSARFNNRDTIFEFVSQPIGPRKLAKVLLLSLRRWIKLQASAISIAIPSPLNTVEATPSDLAPDAGIRLTPELEYFCRPFKKEETVADPATEDGIAQDSQQRGETVVLRTAEAGCPIKENEIRSGGLPERPNEDSVPTLVPAPQTTTVSEPDASGPRFLLVDDNPINLRILVSYVKKLGHRFTCATNGLEAFEAFKEGIGQGADHFKFILMDISMPVMDGFESTRRIRALEMERGLSRCNIFALTGLASASAQQEAFASGIDLFLTKPVRLKELNKILESKGVS